MRFFEYNDNYMQNSIPSKCLNEETEGKGRGVIRGVICLKKRATKSRCNVLHIQHDK